MSTLIYSWCRGLFYKEVGRLWRVSDCEELVGVNWRLSDSVKNWWGLFTGSDWNDLHDLCQSVLILELRCGFSEVEIFVLFP